MPTLAARIAPQRSTQYAALASALALPEWRMSPLGKVITAARVVQFGGGDYLLLELGGALESDDLQTIGRLAMTAEVFEYHAEVGGVTGPFLRPLQPLSAVYLPPDLVYTRRYKGKTNELFSRFLLNAACFGAGWTTGQAPSQPVVLDPLCGGGTILFQALVYGWDALGVDHSRHDIETTETFLRQYLRSQGIRFRYQEERLREIGRRYDFSIETGQGKALHCVLACADTSLVARALEGRRVHLVVADLPYGVQHKGALVELLSRGLPVWASLLKPGGALALAWEASRLPREEMIGLVEAVVGLVVLRGGPYEELAHPVDRVIKRRDVVVARKAL